MRNYFLAMFLSLCVVNVFAGDPLKVTECPGAAQFFHGSPGNPWVVSNSSGNWIITSAGPGDNSALTSMNADASLKVHLGTSAYGLGVSGLICTYTLSDQTVLKAETTALNGHCPPSEESGATLGNFYEDSDRHVHDSLWNQFFHSTVFYTPAVSCDTNVAYSTYCNVSGVVTENVIGYHDCRDFM